MNYIFTDGSSKFQRFQPHPNKKDKIEFILASNASLWYIPEYIKPDENWGYLIQIDHFNSTSEEKYTRVMKCDQMPKDKQEEDQNCTTLHFKVCFIRCKIATDNNIFVAE